MADLSLGRVAVKTMSLFLPQKQNFVFATQAGQEAFYLRETLEDFGYQQQNATEIYEHLLLCVSIQYAEIFRATSTSAVVSCATWSKLVMSN